MGNFDLIKKQQLEDKEKARQRLQEEQMREKRRQEEEKPMKEAYEKDREKKRKVMESLNSMVRKALADFADVAWGKNFLWSKKWGFGVDDRWDYERGQWSVGCSGDSMNVNIWDTNQLEFSLYFHTHYPRRSLSTTCKINDKQLRDGIEAVYVCSQKYKMETQGVFIFNGISVGISDNSWVDSYNNSSYSGGDG